MIILYVSSWIILSFFSSGDGILSEYIVDFNVTEISQVVLLALLFSKLVSLETLDSTNARLISDYGPIIAKQTAIIENLLLSIAQLEKSEKTAETDDLMVMYASQISDRYRRIFRELVSRSSIAVEGYHDATKTAKDLFRTSECTIHVKSHISPKTWRNGNLKDELVLYLKQTKELIDEIGGRDFVRIHVIDDAELKFWSESDWNDFDWLCCCLEDSGITAKFITSEQDCIYPQLSGRAVVYPDLDTNTTIAQVMMQPPNLAQQTGELIFDKDRIISVRDHVKDIDDLSLDSVSFKEKFFDRSRAY